MSRFFTVLCEDLQARVFIYRALRHLGVHARNIRVRPYPDNRFHAAGKGSPRLFDKYVVYACGSQHVQKNFPKELAEVRAQSAKNRDVALVTHIDVDNETAAGRTVQDRQREFDQECLEAGVPKRAASDPVALLIPRRAVETWIEFFLKGQPINEHTAYPKLTEHEADAGPAASAFAVHARAKTIPAHTPPSLVAGLNEFGRIV